jgi:hypothetical protein
MMLTEISEAQSNNDPERATQRFVRFLEHSFDDV